MNEVWQHSRLKGTERLALVALADCANDEGECWPSLITIAHKVNCSVRRVCKIIADIERSCELRRERSNGGRNVRTKYFVTLHENTVTGNSAAGNTVPGNSVPQGKKTLSPSSHAINRHRTVNNSARTKRARRSDTEPRLPLVIAAYCSRYFARTGMRARITDIEGHCFKDLLKDGFDVPEIETALDSYFANEFYAKTGFDVRTFTKDFNKIRSAGAKKHHNFENGAFPDL